MTKLAMVGMKKEVRATNQGALTTRNDCIALLCERPVIGRVSQIGHLVEFVKEVREGNERGAIEQRD